MKTLLKLVVGGTLVFLAIAMTQEWRVFAAPWLGPPAAPQELGETQRHEVVERVRFTLRLMQHVYASGGDPRFLERMPISERIAREMLDDIAYLERNHRRQQLELRRLDVLRLVSLGSERVSLTTRELWSVRYLHPDGTAFDGPLRVEVSYGRYLLAGEGGGWSIHDWEVLPPEWQQEAAR